MATIKSKTPKAASERVDVDAMRKQAKAKAERFNARRREFPGAVIWHESDADPGEWESRVLMADLRGDARSRVERKLRAMAFQPASEWGVDGLAVSGDNDAVVWLLPRDVYEATHGARKRAQAAEKSRSAGVAARPAGPAHRTR